MNITAVFITNKMIEILNAQLFIRFELKRRKFKATNQIINLTKLITSLT